uniref:Uncharacterized protein n=1 Tax=Anguilla anguilla TaxID=7936 RepID=A0A0E9PTG2_ANGAN
MSGLPSSRPRTRAWYHSISSVTLLSRKSLVWKIMLRKLAALVRASRAGLR